MRSDFADIYLVAHCEFFISTPSGLDGMAQIFRKPLLLVNLSPAVKDGLDYWYPSRLFTIKKIFDKTRNQFVPWQEFDNALQQADNLQTMLERLNWVVVENNEDEILEAVREMEDTFDKEPTLDKTPNFMHELLKTQLPLLIVSGRDVLRENPEKFYIRMCSQFFKENYLLVSDKNVR